ncbi:MAG: phage portal protein [Saccharofermentanales bacterium]
MKIIDKVRTKISDWLNPKGEESMQKLNSYFTVLTGYSPVFSSFEGGVYEMELTRAAIDAFARHCSKLKPEILGSAQQRLKHILISRANPWQTQSQFLYQLATIYMVNNNALILPVEDIGGNLIGFNAVCPDGMEIVEHKGQLYIVYQLGTARHAIEYDRAGIITRHQYRNPFLGDTNKPLSTTMELIHTQNEGIKAGIKAGGAVRFAAKISEVLKDETVKSTRERFIKDNLNVDNGGLVLYDNKMSEFRQLESKPVWIDDKQSSLIKQNIYSYFGVNEKILQNQYDEDLYNAFYEGMIEPWALQLGQVQTAMTFSYKELSYGNEIMYSSNQLQYSSNRTKLAISSSMLDRGVLNRNEVREIWQLPNIGPEGDLYVIRGEYVNAEEVEGEDNAD